MKVDGSLCLQCPPTLLSLCLLLSHKLNSIVGNLQYHHSKALLSNQPKMLYYVPLVFLVMAAVISAGSAWRQSRRLKKIHEKFPIVGNSESADLTEALVEGTKRVSGSVILPSDSTSISLVALYLNTKS